MPGIGDRVCFHRPISSGFESFVVEVVDVRPGGLLDLEYVRGFFLSVPGVDSFDDDPEEPFWSLGLTPDDWPERVLDLTLRYDFGFVGDMEFPTEIYTYSDQTWRYS